MEPMINLIRIGEALGPQPSSVLYIYIYIIFFSIVINLNILSLLAIIKIVAGGSFTHIYT